MLRISFQMSSSRNLPSATYLPIQSQQRSSTSSSLNSQRHRPHTVLLSDFQPIHRTRTRRNGRARRRRTRLIRPRHQRLTSREVLPAQKPPLFVHLTSEYYAEVLYRSWVRRAKVNREIKGACHSATGLNNSRPVVVAVEADVVRWNIDWCRRRCVEGVRTLGDLE